MKRPFYPYYRDIQNANRQVLPTVETQREWVRRRMADHPFAEVVEMGVEEEYSYEGPNTSSTDRMKRPVLSKIIDATKDFFHPANGVILIPEMPTHYRYKWIFDEFAEHKDSRENVERHARNWVPIHPYIRQGKERKAFIDNNPQPSGSIHLLGEMSFEELWQTIQAECTYFLGVVKKVNSHLLFRGVGEHDNGPAYIGYPENSRTPKTVKIEIHNYVDGWMQKKGFAARRGNSITCTSHPEYARTFSKIVKKKWAKIYAIFPRDGFKFSWARNAMDIITLCEGSKFQVFDQDVPRPSDWLGNWDQSLEEKLWYADYVSVDLAGALRSENEIMISGSSYYALDWSVYRQAILKKLGFKLQNRPFARLVAERDQRQEKGVIDKWIADSETYELELKKGHAERRKQERDRIAAILADAKKGWNSPKE